MDVKNKLIRKLTSKSVKHQLIVCMVSTSAALLLVLGMLLYSISKNTLEKNIRENHANYMKLFSSSIRIRLEDIIGDARELLADDSYVSVMTEETEGSAYFSSVGQTKIEKSLLSITGDNQYVVGVLTINDFGKFRYISKYSDDEMNSYYSSGDLLEQPWVQAAENAMGKEVVYGYNVLNESDERCFSLVKRMNRLDSLQGYGYLVLTISKTMLKEIIGTNIDAFENNPYLIVDFTKLQEDGEPVIIYHNVDEEELEDILVALKGERANKVWLFTEYREKSTGWVIVGVTNRKELSQESAYIKWATFMGIFVLLIICFPVANYVMGQIYRPLALLKDTISFIGQGNYKPDIEFDNSEIGRIGQYLIEISSNNLALRENLLQAKINEREAKLLLLQSQINPHFLYNTLDALYFMAVIDGVDDIAEMVRSLSDTFKIALNNGDSMITIRDELERIRAYMRIQNMRYQDRFELKVDVEESILDEKILSFLLQPIIENAVTHGLESKIGNGAVSLVGYREEELIRVIISDNGIGIRDLSVIDKGYGVRNVRERIRLFYGEEYDVVFDSEEGKGTTVFFRLPVWRKDDMSEKAGSN